MLAAKLRDRALQAGTTKLLVFASLLSLALGALVYYQYVTPQAAANDALRESLANKRKQNAIARMVQETKPQFLDQFRRLISNYTTGANYYQAKLKSQTCPTLFNRWLAPTRYAYLCSTRPSPAPNPQTQRPKQLRRLQHQPPQPRNRPNRKSV